MCIFCVLQKPQQQRAELLLAASDQALGLRLAHASQDLLIFIFFSF
jgi:hypothetical protein